MENKPYSIQDLFENREKVRQVVNSIAKDVKDVTDNLSKQASKPEVKDNPVEHPSHYTSMSFPSYQLNHITYMALGQMYVYVHILELDDQEESSSYNPLLLHQVLPPLSL